MLRGDADCVEKLGVPCNLRCSPEGTGDGRITVALWTAISRYQRHILKEGGGGERQHKHQMPVHANSSRRSRFSGWSGDCQSHVVPVDLFRAVSSATLVVHVDTSLPHCMCLIFLLLVQTKTWPLFLLQTGGFFLAGGAIRRLYITIYPRVFCCFSLCQVLVCHSPCR